jgi:hypothetical protein
MDHVFNDHAEEVDVAVTYSVLVDVPQDIGYKDKYPIILPIHKSISNVPNNDFGRWYAQGNILPSKSTNHSTTDNKSLPTQTVEETCTTTSEDTDDYWNRDRWTDEEEEEEINMDFADTEERDLWPSYPDYTPDTVRGHPSVSLLPLSSPTLHLFICIPPPHLCTIFKDHT